MSKKIVLDKNWLACKYIDERLTLVAIAELAGCCVDTVRREVYANTLTRKHLPGKPAYEWTEERDYYLITAWEALMPIKVMTRELRCSEDLVRRRVKQLGLGDRKWWAGSLRDRVCGYGAGYREDLGFHVRSRWEANVARVLKYDGISFLYEPYRMPVFFKNRHSTYLPDFLLTDRGSYLEVKGRSDNDSLEKLNCVIQQYPDKIFEIVGEVEYRQLRSSYYDSVKWEECRRWNRNAKSNQY